MSWTRETIYGQQCSLSNIVSAGRAHAWFLLFSPLIDYVNSIPTWIMLDSSDLWSCLHWSSSPGLICDSNILSHSIYTDFIKHFILYSMLLGAAIFQGISSIDLSRHKARNWEHMLFENQRQANIFEDELAFRTAGAHPVRYGYQGGTLHVSRAPRTLRWWHCVMPKLLTFQTYKSLSKHTCSDNVRIMIRTRLALPV